MKNYKPGLGNHELNFEKDPTKDPNYVREENVPNLLTSKKCY